MNSKPLFLDKKNESKFFEDKIRSLEKRIADEIGPGDSPCCTTIAKLLSIIYPLSAKLGPANYYEFLGAIGDLIVELSQITAELSDDEGVETEEGSDEDELPPAKKPGPEIK